MAAVDPQQLRQQAPAWVRGTREEAARELESMRHALSATLNALATDLAARARDDDVASVEEIQEAATAFLGTTRRLMTRLCDRLAEGLHERLRPLLDLTVLGVDAASRLVNTELARWETAIRFQEATHAQYCAGWIEAGGLPFALMVQLPAEATRRPEAYRDILKGRLAFVGDRAEAGIAQWLDEVDRGISTLVTQVGSQVAEAPSAVSAAAPTQARLDALLGRAEALNVRIRNVPAEPSERYLQKLQAQLDQIERTRETQAIAEHTRKARLEELMRFAQALGVRPKDVPADPSEAWLDRMEAKLVDMARAKGVALPSTIEPPTGIEDHATLLPPPEREAKPEPQLSVRVQALVDRAESVGLELGRIPEVPSEGWVADTEAKLEGALEERRSRRREMRLRQGSEFEDRFDRLEAQSRQLGISLGAIPEPLTEEWLTGAELAMASALMEAEAGAFRNADDDDPITEAADHDEQRRAIRLRVVLNAASSAGVDLGILPNDPDDVWLTWAEQRVAEARSGDHAVAVEAVGADVPQAFLVYEEGTVQEQLWPLGKEAITIGRSRGNDVQIQNDPAVSRRHATLHLRDGRYLITDLGSTKGTLVDNRLIDQDQPLQDGSRIQVGGTDFVFRLRSA